MPRAHPPEFRHRAIELARLVSLPVGQIAIDLGISDSRLAAWGRAGPRCRRSGLSRGG